MISSANTLTCAKVRRILATAYAQRIRWKSREKPSSDASEPISFEEYKAFVADYTLDKTAEMTGVPKDQLEQLAQLYADPKKKVISYWTMGFNQHTRGVWANNTVYNLHLLTGKISQRLRTVLADRSAFRLWYRP